MLARGALCRLAAEVPKQAAHDLPKLASLVQSARAGYSLPIRTLSRASQLQVRSYVTETVEKAVKAKAAAGKSVTKTTTAKKPAAKKAAKKAAPKKAKKKKAKKAAPRKSVRKPKKELTEEQKENKAITKLRELALREPVSRIALSAFRAYVSEAIKGTERVQLGEAANMWKNISPAEHEKWNHIAAERNEARAAEYRAWVESHTPDRIRIANNARRQLRKKLTAKKLAQNSEYKRAPVHTQPIEDPRQVKRIRNAWTFFVLERSPSTDFKGIAVSERFKLIGEEWKALDASEKQRFDDMAAADKQRRNRELAAQQTA